MSGVELKPIGVSGSQNILVPLGTTTVGRGPFLGVADKRVSRNHAILDVVDGKLKVKPIHVNPTFCQKKGGIKFTPLPKDVWQDLQNGDQISLTPNEHIFEVFIDESPVYATQSPRSSVGSASPVKSFHNTQDSPQKLSQLNEDEDAPSPARKKLDFNADNKEYSNGAASITTDKDTEKNRDMKDEEPKEDEVELKNDKRPAKKEFAKPVDRERELPDWMKKLAPGQPEEEKQEVKPKGRGRQKQTQKQEAKKTATPKPARKRPVEEEDEEEVFEEKTPPKKQRGQPKGNAKKKTSESFSDDSELLDSPPTVKRGTSSRGRKTTSVSYADDWNVEDEEEFILKDSESDEDDDDNDSDWEEDSKGRKKGKGRGKGKSPVTPGKGKKRKGKRGRYSDSEESDEEVYIPKPTRRRGGTLSQSQESTESEERSPVKKTSRRNVRSSKKENKNNEDDDSEVNDGKADDGEEEKTSKKSCQYGKECYRKNPAHFKEFLHPGDSGYKSGDDEDMGDEDDDRPECEYGLECYRKNPDHKKEYKHTKLPKRSRKQTKKKSIVAGDSDDDGDVNTYDYNDSFLDDQEEDESDSPLDPADEDSDYVPDTQGSGENVKDLVREAKGFIKNKKMQQKVT